MDDNSPNYTIIKVVLTCALIIAAVLLGRSIKNDKQLPTEISPTSEAISVTVTVTATPTPTLPVSPILYTSTPSPSPEPTPTPTCTPTPIPQELVRKDPSYKPYTDYRCYNLKGSREYQLQQMAKTDIYGLRVVKDSNGEERWCVALGKAWAGGKEHKFAGTCIDILMENGTVLKCVYGDVKKTEHTIKGEGRYGRKGELIEFIIDSNAVPQMVKTMGDASYCGDIFMGYPVEVRLRDDVTIPGLD